MGNAIWVSTRSPSERLKVGAVIVKHNRILSAGYNGFPAGVPHISIMKDTHEQNTIHAEQNAICDVGRRGGTKLFGSINKEKPKDLSNLIKTSDNSSRELTPEEKLLNSTRAPQAKILRK